MKDEELIKRVVNEVQKVIIGKNDKIYDVLKGILAQGHILIEDVPGVGKTTLVKTLAKTIDLKYNRIQFTPDLLPSDITGISIYNIKEMKFEFKKGPIFSNIVLADEINRTSPKTQSALLEVMEESQVSDSGICYKIPKPFIVMATENPIEYDGTYILPEAQLDRFIIKISLGYPKEDDEEFILKKYGKEDPKEGIVKQIKSEELIDLQEKVKKINIADSLNKYIVDIGAKTRNNKYISLGASTRALIDLQKIAKAQAFIRGEKFVIPDDIKSNVKLVLEHRLILSQAARARGIQRDEVLNQILSEIECPKVC